MQYGQAVIIMKGNCNRYASLRIYICPYNTENSQLTNIKNQPCWECFFDFFTPVPLKLMSSAWAVRRWSIMLLVEVLHELVNINSFPHTLLQQHIIFFTLLEADPSHASQSLKYSCTLHRLRLLPLIGTVPSYLLVSSFKRLWPSLQFLLSSCKSCSSLVTPSLMLLIVASFCLPGTPAASSTSSSFSEMTSRRRSESVEIAVTLETPLSIQLQPKTNRIASAHIAIKFIHICDHADGKDVPKETIKRYIECRDS